MSEEFQNRMVESIMMLIHLVSFKQTFISLRKFYSVCKSNVFSFHTYYLSFEKKNQIFFKKQSISKFVWYLYDNKNFGLRFRQKPAVIKKLKTSNSTLLYVLRKARSVVGHCAMVNCIKVYQIKQPSQNSVYFALISITSEGYKGKGQLLDMSELSWIAGRGNYSKILLYVSYAPDFHWPTLCLFLWCDTKGLDPSQFTNRHRNLLHPAEHYITSAGDERV